MRAAAFGALLAARMAPGATAPAGLADLSVGPGPAAAAAVFCTLRPAVARRLAPAEHRVHAAATTAAPPAEGPAGVSLCTAALLLAPAACRGATLLAQHALIEPLAPRQAALSGQPLVGPTLTRSAACPHGPSGDRLPATAPAAPAMDRRGDQAYLARPRLQVLLGSDARAPTPSGKVCSRSFSIFLSIQKTI